MAGGIAILLGASSLMAHDGDDNDRGRDRDRSRFFVSAELIGYQEVPALSTTARVYSWNVPLACFAAPDVRIRLRRTGSNCIEADFARLTIQYRN